MEMEAKIKKFSAFGWGVFLWGITNLIKETGFFTEFLGDNEVFL